ncbi:MAG: ABC transporter ATP-binding protein [Bacilli bacterium]
MIRILAQSIKNYKKAAILTIVFVTLEAMFETTIPYIMAKMINEMKVLSDIQPIINYGIVLIILACCSLTFGIFSAVFSAEAGCGYAKNLRRDLYYKVQDYSFKEIDKFSTSSLVTRLTTDITNVQMAYEMIIRGAVRTPLMIIFSFIMSFLISWKMALIFVAIIPILVLALWLLLSKAFPLFKKIFKKYDSMNNSVQENIEGIRVTKSFVREEYEKSKFDFVANDVKKNFTKAEKLVALNNPIMIFVIFIAMLCVSYFGSRMIINTGATELDIGDLSSLITYGMQILTSVMMLSMVFILITIASESSRRIAEVLTTESSLNPNLDGLENIEDGDIEFKGVNFKYSEEANKFALKNIDLKIRSGETIGIIGGIGSSKTTLIQLICRLYDTTEGEVLVGGVDVKEYNLKDLRDQVAVVLQKNVLFSGTIKENICWGKPDATDAEIENVCKIAQADEFIQQLPDKYDTFIERGGTNVSGGQKQRLCIARALIKNPKIIIFDDSTSAVDTKTDAKIRKAMAEEIPNTTKIIIAQRIASVQDADRIAVMSKGEIVEIGSHDELIKLNGIYSEVFTSQTTEKGGQN